MIESKTVPNLIQGVSQQSAQQRRDSQCESQYDCINSPKDGAVARPGFDCMTVVGVDLTGAFCFEIARSETEHYFVAIKSGTTRIYNLAQGGVACSVSEIATGYLSYDTRGFAKQTVQDTTFLASKAKKPEMLTTLSSTRPPECLLVFKAGAYLNKYSIAVSYGGTVYRFSYTTPDNSTAGNAAYINTSQLAATFYRAMTGSTAPINAYGVGGAYSGDAGGSGSGTTSVVSTPGSTLTSIGFSVEINGNLLRIWRDDEDDFDVDVSDGQGGTALVALKDNIQTFSALPRGGFEGMIFRVRPKGSESSASDYYVEFVAKTATSGYWQERVAPGVPTSLDPDTMPYRLINNDVNDFTVTRASWSSRVAGDGVETAKDPGFVGKEIKRIFYHKGRLALMTEATVDFSKARSPFTFFPDTAQTILPSDNIGIELNAPDSAATLTQVSQVDEVLMLWAQRAQFRVTSGNDPFRQDTVEADPSTAFEYSDDVEFFRMGSGLYFATEADDYASIRNLQFQGGRPLGDLDISDHVPELIPAGVTRIAGTDTGKMLAVHSSGGGGSNLYVYNFLVQDKTIVQSAWNVWRLPEGEVIWHSVFRMKVYVALVRNGKTLLLSCPLRASEVDTGLTYRTRLDLRLTEEDVSMSYDAELDETQVTLPYGISADELANFKIALRETDGDPEYAPGTIFTPSSGAGPSTVFNVPGDITARKFFAGLTVVSERTESEFFLRGPTGLIPTDELVISSFSVDHAKTGYYRIEVSQGGSRSKSEELPVYYTNEETDLLAPPDLRSGKLTVDVQEEARNVSIRLVNDSVLPSRWQSAEFRYSKVLRARPSNIRPQE